jgi:hypothetical protein
VSVTEYVIRWRLFWFERWGGSGPCYTDDPTKAQRFATATEAALFTQERSWAFVGFEVEPAPSLPQEAAP